MKVVHVITRFIPAGGDMNTLLTCVRHAEAGYDVILVTGVEVDPQMVNRLPPEVPRYEVPELVRTISPYHDLIAVARLARLLKRLSPHVVHTHNSKAGILGRVAAYLAGIPCVHTVHIAAFIGERGLKRAIYRFAEAACVRLTSAFIFVSEGLEKEYVCSVPLRGVASHVIHSGMDVKAFLAARDRPDRSGSFVKFFAAGLLEPRKRLCELIEELSHLADVEGWHLRIAGTGIEEAPIREAIRRAGLEDRVELIGFCKNMAEEFAAADAFVHASRVEGLPQVAIQALASGVPVVAHPLPGASGILVHERNALLGDGESERAIVRAMRRLMDEPTLLADLRRGARTFDPMPWSDERMTGRIAEVYERVA